VGTGNASDSTDQTAVTVDLFNGYGNDPGTATIDGSNSSTTSKGGSQVAYNDAAYNNRIALMKQMAISYHPNYNTSTNTINPPPTASSVYPPPYTTDSDRFALFAAYLSELKTQAKLMFPNGRIVNQRLEQALQKVNASGQLADANSPLSLSENSAINAALCAGRILIDSSFTPSTTPVLPHGAIKEASFVDAKEVKAIVIVQVAK